MLKRAIPIFIANAARRAALTRIVDAVDHEMRDGKIWHRFTETTDGPFNGLRNGPLWTIGEVSIHDPIRWKLEDV